MYQTGAVMFEGFDFETIPPRGDDHPGRSRDQLARRLSRDDIRKQNNISTSRREAAKIQLMIASLNSDIAILENTIAADLEKSWVKDPRNPNFSILLRTLMTRRDNLKDTVIALANRLNKTESILREIETA
jgi:hypothetical protein